MRRDHDVTKQQDLIDLDVTDNQRSQGQPLGIAVMTNSHTRESAHSSDTVVKTPHRRGSTDMYSAAFEPFESDKSSHSMDKLGLDRDLFAEHDVRPSTIHAQAPSDLLSEMTDEKEVKEANNNTTLDSFLAKSQRTEVEPGGTEIFWARTNNQISPDLLTTSPSVVNHDNGLTLTKSECETPSRREDILRKHFMQDSTTSHQRFTIHPTVLKPTVLESLENQCRHTPILISRE